MFRLELNIVKVPIEEKPILNNLMQLYLYDFSEFMDCDVEDNGLFGEYPYLDDYWISVEHRFPYFIKRDGKNVGFILVRYIDSSDTPHFSMAEFFIMKKYRRLGLGKHAAMKVFDMHRGRWEVTQLERNIPAQQFWNRVITEYTSGRFSSRMESEKYIQAFFN
ncbi:Predicted acetyltransferase [Chlamydia abortus]|uniref:GNAT family N-acetyltransferase n=1 Tax=Paenibacillus residui TaxID=629724 RepID=A0ABW3DAF0_9BACL|nr:Predicted acetyltransferase [Chlamydia abortus]